LDAPRWLIHLRAALLMRSISKSRQCSRLLTSSEYFRRYKEYCASAVLFKAAACTSGMLPCRQQLGTSSSYWWTRPAFIKIGRELYTRAACLTMTSSCKHSVGSRSVASVTLCTRPGDNCSRHCRSARRAHAAFGGKGTSCALSCSRAGTPTTRSTPRSR